MNRTQNVSRNIVWGMVNKIISAILPFISRTVILYKMGSLYLGIGSLFSSILGMLSLAELGFSSAIIFSMYKPLADGDDNLVCALLAFYRKCYRIIGIVIFIIGLILLPFLKHLISGSYPQDINIYVIYFITLVNTVSSYGLFAYKKSLLQANQRADLESNIATLVLVIQHILQIIIISIFENYYFYSLAACSVTIVGNLMVNYVTNKIYPQFQCKGALSEEHCKDLYQKLGGLICQKIGNVVLGSVDNIIISAFLGLTILAHYNNYYCIITALFGFIGIVSNSLKLSVGNAVAKESVAKNYDNFKTFNLLYTMMISWISICYLSFIQPFMYLWMGRERMLSNGIAVLSAVYIFIFKWCDMLYVYQEAKGIWWRTKFVPLIAAALNLTVNIILVKRIGLPGILISTIVSMLFIYNLGYAKILYEDYFSGEGSLKDYLTRQAYYLIAEGALLSLCYFINFSFHIDSIVLTIFKAAVCVLAASVILILEYCWLPEFKDAMRYVMRMMKRD